MSEFEKFRAEIEKMKLPSRVKEEIYYLAQLFLVKDIP